MKYMDEFRGRPVVRSLARRIDAAIGEDREYKFMEVCGTHTMAIFRFGLKTIISKNIKLISGPGCPVCVTPVEYIDRAIAIARLPGVIIATFGDMLRVPGSRSSLDRERSDGRRISVVYSTDDALEIARRHPENEVVFLGVGFETTAPTVAASVISAKKMGIDNYSVLSAHKTMPGALEALLEDGDTEIDGFLLPGHVSAITGTAPYEFIPKRYGAGCVVAGFEPADILQAVLMLLVQKKPKVEVQYKRIVNRSGNRLAREIMYRVFEPSSSIWRGMGKVKDSGLSMRREFSGFDAALRFKVRIDTPRENKSCICSEVLKGVKTPVDCRLFGRICRPEDPVGSCMVSSEGTCAAYYKYGRA